ncbi:MAG: endonuclease domain-containing protein [candidate division FCPU426 bacterium]
MTLSRKKAPEYYNLTPLARKLRKEDTPEESLLWDRLRGRRFGLLKFKRQFQVGVYIVDFICLEKGLVIELDGNGHFSAKGRQADENRDRELLGLGLKVMRFTNDRIRNDLEAVLMAIQAGLK